MKIFDSFSNELKEFLKDRISLGYNFNSGITSIEKAKENFKKYLDVDEIHNDFSYKQYYNNINHFLSLSNAIQFNRLE